MSYPLARRYAQALYEICDGKQTADAVAKDLESIAHGLIESRELTEFIKDASIPREQQENIISRIFKKRVHETTHKFLMFLINKSRLAILPLVCQAFEDMVLQANNIVKTTIASSFPLDAKQVASIKKHLKDRWHKDIRESLLLEPGTLGGVKVRVGDNILDYTLRAQLENFRTNFLRAA